MLPKIERNSWDLILNSFSETAIILLDAVSPSLSLSLSIGLHLMYANISVTQWRQFAFEAASTYFTKQRIGLVAKRFY